MTETIIDLLNSTRAARRQAFHRLAATPEAHLNKMTRWGRGPADARYLFLRFADHEEEHAHQVGHTLRHALGWQPTKVQMVLGMAERTRGDVLAALTGLSEGDMNSAPAEPAGEWTLRQILTHLVATEHSYRINTLHAAEQHRKGQPHGDLPARGDESAFAGMSFDDLLTAFDAARNQSIAELSELPDDVLPATAVWGGIEVDVTFRLMRFSHHEREHAAHIQKWRVQTGKHQTDAQRLMGLAWQSHGLMRSQLAGVPEDLAAKDPGAGEWTILQILDHVQDADEFFERMIHAAK